jgi:hypothetical protein
MRQAAEINFIGLVVGVAACVDRVQKWYLQVGTLVIPSIGVEGGTYPKWVTAGCAILKDRTDAASTYDMSCFP